MTDVLVDRIESHNKAVRTVAAFEAFKGLLVLTAGLGLLSLMHRDISAIAEHFVRAARFDPEGKYPRIFLDWVDHLQDMNMWSLLAIATAYVVIRLAEAYGLWRGRAWGEWLGVLSGAIYLPMEISHLIHKPTVQIVLMLTLNVAVVALLAYRLLVRRRKALETLRSLAPADKNAAAGLRRQTAL